MGGIAGLCFLSRGRQGETNQYVSTRWEKKIGGGEVIDMFLVSQGGVNQYVSKEFRNGWMER